MQTLSRQLRQPVVGGEPMPSVFHQLSMIGADARRGEVMMIVGQPSAGKSILTTWMGLKWVQDHNLKGIYWSADATVRPSASRLAAMATRHSLAEVEEALEKRNDPVIDKAIDDLSHAGFHWVFDASITGDSLELNMVAFQELWGADPDWVVLDNLTDVDTRDGEEFSVLRATMRDVNYLARESNAAMVVLHHTSEDFKDDPIPPRKAIHGKVSVKPTIILGTARPPGGHHKPIGALKNRYGEEDRTGHRAHAWVSFDSATYQFGSYAGAN